MDGYICNERSYSRDLKRLEKILEDAKSLQPQSFTTNNRTKRCVPSDSRISPNVSAPSKSPRHAMDQGSREGRTFCFDVIISATIFARRKSAGGNMIGLNQQRKSHASSRSFEGWVWAHFLEQRLVIEPSVNCMWIINNSLDVIRPLEEKQLSLNHVSTWDFSTLYTSLPHAQLKKQLHDLLERVFNTKGKSFIATNNFRTFWANDKTSTRYTYFSCRELGLAIDFLIDNIYVRFGSSVFRQVIGIPMGTNSAPLLADLFLHTFEYDFMVKTMKQDITKAIQFSNTFRYIDDLFSINNVNFGNCISAIYPSELELKDTSTSSTEVCYLDTNIKTGNVTTPFRISIYDKRDYFAFRIINFPHMDSNIPANPVYSVYISQLVWYVRISTSKVDFINRLRGLSLRLRQQGFETNRLQNSFNKFVNRHGLIVEKYGAALREMRLAIQA